MEKENFSLYQTQVQTNVGFTSFMTAVVVFFAGLLLSSFHNYDITIKVPIAYLLISLFGFLYSSVIYTSAAEEVSHKKIKPYKRYMFLGDIISEYLGVYLLVISIPMVVSAITTDGFLRTVTIVSALAGLAIYQFSHASILERNFGKKHKTLSILALVLGGLLTITQITGFYFVLASVAFLLFMLIVTFLATKSSR